MMREHFGDTVGHWSELFPPPPVDDASVRRHPIPSLAVGKECRDGGRGLLRSGFRYLPIHAPFAAPGVDELAQA